jgi:hypothetical protein
LIKVFERCRLYGVSLNPRKCLFVVTQGKLLGHIVCKEGIYIDMKRVKAINELNPPTSKKGFQSFFGKIIYPIRHSNWISNPVIVLKNTKEIQMCIEFRDLN